MFAGIVLIPFGIPGTFLIVAAAFVYAWATDFVIMTIGFVGLLLLLAVLIEVVEFFLGALTAGKYGSSRMGMIGSILGGFFGAIWGVPFFPPIGILIGAFLGAFVGATLFEFVVSKDMKHSIRVGKGAFLGSVAGKLAKIAAAVAMVVMVGIKIF